MARAEIPICPHCNAQMKLALPPGGKGARVYRCLECDDTDPMEIAETKGWLQSRLQPPK